MLRLLILLCSLTALARADVRDLEQLLKDLEQQTAPAVPPKLPEIVFSSSNYKAYNDNNIFDSGRVDNYVNDALMDFNLSQLKMVGYMQYAGVDYAFVTTPHETLKVKLGDKIKNGTICKISPSTLEIDEIQITDNKTYVNKIYLELNSAKIKKLPKLQPR